MPFISGPPDGSSLLEPDAPSLPSRYLEGVANFLPEIGRQGQDFLQQIGFSEDSEPTPKPFDDLYNIPAARNWKETGTDLAASLTKAAPLIATGEFAGAGVAELAGLQEGSAGYRALKLAGGFGVQGAESGGAKEGAVQAGVGAAMAPVEMLPARYRVPLSLLLGAGTYGVEKEMGATDKQALTQGSINAAIPMVSPLLGAMLKRFGNRAESPVSKASEFTENPEMGKPQELTPFVQDPNQSTGAGNGLRAGNGLNLDQQLAKFDQEDADEVAALQQRLAPKPAAAPVQPIAAAAEIPPAVVIPPVEPAAAAAPVEPAPAAAVDPATINPSRQLRLKTVLHPDDPEMIQKAATKLNLQFQGVTMPESESPFLEFKVPENGEPNAEKFPEELRGANITPRTGETMADLRDRLAWKSAQFTAKSAEELDAVNKKFAKISGYTEPAAAPADVPVVADANPPPVVATLQSEVAGAASVSKAGRLETLRKVQQAGLAREAEAPPPSPLRAAEVAPVFKEGDTVYYDAGDGPEMAKVKSVGADGSTKIKLVGDGSGWEVHQDSLSANKPGHTLDDVIKYKGNLEDLAALEEQNSAKEATGMKLKIKPGEYGGIDPELAVALGRYVASPVIGSIVGAATADPDERLKRAMLGALVGLGAGHFGPSALKFLTELHPDIKTAGSLPARVAEILSAGKQVVKGAMMDKDMAAAAIASGKATGAERFARWMEKRWGRDSDAIRLLQKAHGEAQLKQGAILQDAVQSIAKDPSYQDAAQRKAIADFWTGKTALPALKTALNGNDDLINKVVLASQTEQSLQSMILKSMKEDDPLAKEILKSKGKYLTSVYDFYTDKTFWPSDEAIAKAAKDIDERFGSDNEVRINQVNQFLREERSRMSDYRAGKRQQGEAFGNILARDKDVPQSWKEMLGIIDDPVQRMAATGMKLVTGARVAEFYDLIDQGTSSQNGLKFAYTGDELAQTRNNLRDKLSAAKDSQQIATLQKQLLALKGYMSLDYDARYGKLSGKWIDHSMHDQLMTADSLSENFRAPWAQQMANWTNMIKLGHTLLSPFQFTRQVMSLPSLGILSGTGPGDWIQAAKPLMRIATGKATAEDLAWELRLRGNGIMYGDIITGQFFKDMQPMLNGTLDNLASKSGIKDKLVKWSEFYRMPDLITRVARFQKSEEAALAAGKSAEEAETIGINDANRYAINYAAVPKGVQRYRQMPFINQYLSWAYEMARITKNLVEDSAKGDIGAATRLITVAGAPFVMANLSEQFNLNDKDRADWRTFNRLSPDYNRLNFKFVWGRDEQTGRFHYTDFTPIVIQDQILKMMRGVMHGDAGVVAESNPVIGWENTPLLNVARNQASGMDIHTQQKFSTASAGANLADRFTSLRKDVAPTLFGGTDFDKLVSALTPNAQGGLGVTNTRTGQGNSIGQFVLSYITGTKNYTGDLGYQQQRYLSDVSQQIREEIARYSTIRNSDMSNDLKRSAILRIQQRVESIKEDARSQLGLNQNQ